MAPIAPLVLNDALRAIGNAELLVSLTGPAGPTWGHLGAMEGERSFRVGYTHNDLTAPEYTGGAVHQRASNVETAEITANVIVGDPDLWAKINPFGLKGGGYSSFRSPRTVAAVLIPKDEVGDGLTNPAGTSAGWVRVPAGGGTNVTGIAAAPKSAIWLPRATISHGDIPFNFGDGGKSIVPVTITAMFYAAAAEGYKLYAIGDPNAAPSYGVIVT